MKYQDRQYKSRLTGKTIDVVFIGEENVKIEYKGMTTNMSRYHLDTYYNKIKGK